MPDPLRLLVHRACFTAGTIVFSLLSTSAQSYHSMLGNLSEWYVTYCHFGICSEDYYQAYGDTSVNGIHYKYLDQYHFNKNFLIREDTVAGKVYILPPSLLVSEGEVLVYDFSLQAGDSIEVHNPAAPAPSDAGKYIVDSTRTEFFLGVNRKALYLTAVDSIQAGFSHSIWIEGIGSRSLINTPGAGPQLNGIGSLSCFFKDGVRLFHDTTNLDTCDSQISNFLDRTEHYSLNPVQVFPSYFDRDLGISNPLQEEIIFELYDVMGKRILEKRIGPARVEKLPVAVKFSGTYIARFSTSDGQYLGAVQLIKSNL